MFSMQVVIMNNEQCVLVTCVFGQGGAPLNALLSGRSAEYSDKISIVHRILTDSDYNCFSHSLAALAPLLLKSFTLTLQAPPDNKQE